MPIRALLALFVLAVAATAQADGQHLFLYPAMEAVGPPVDLGTYHVLEQGFVGPLEGVVPVLENSDVGPTYWVFYPPDPVNYALDWTSFAGDGTASISALRVAYASSTPGTTGLTINLHQGELGFGNFGRIIATFPLTGLPGSPDGVTTSYVMDVDLGTTVMLPEGVVGWSFQSADATTGALIVNAPGDPGIQDAIDYYLADEALTYVWTIWFGGEPYGSFFLEMLTEQPAECLLVIGDGPGDATHFDIDHLFETQLDGVEDAYAVLLDDVPEFVLPVPGGRAGQVVPGPLGTGSLTATVTGDGPVGTPPVWMLDGDFAVQVLMWNPQVFPGLPEQHTAGLHVSIQPDGSVLTTPFGTDQGGLQLWHELDTNAAGQPVIRFPFSIPGFAP